jgi:hypothetical protein
MQNSGQPKTMLIPLKVKGGSMRIDVDCVGFDPKYPQEIIPLINISLVELIRTFRFCPVEKEDWYFEILQIPDGVEWLKIEIKLTDSELIPLCPNKQYLIRVEDLAGVAHAWNHSQPTQKFDNYEDWMNYYVRLFVKEGAEIIEIIDEE